MRDPVKLGLLILVAILGVAILMRILGILISIVTPLAIVAGVGLLLYGLFSKKSLGGGPGRLP